MKKHFKNKTVLITGSSSGIGRTTALECCKNGAKVILNGRNEEKLKQTQLDFEKQGFKVDYFTADITQLEDCKRLTDQILQKFGEIDVVVANASLGMSGRFEDAEPNYYKQTIDSSLYSVIMPLFTFLPHLKNTKGSFVIVGSIAGMHGVPTASAYCIGKMALTALHQSLCAELSIYQIHIGIIYLGFTENDTNKQTFNANGELVNVPKRNKLFLQTQEHVARSIMKMIKYRKSKMVMSLAGITIYYISRFFPSIIIWLGKRHQKNWRTLIKVARTKK